ncbi:hypothetical protein [Enterococcus alishanensis]
MTTKEFLAKLSPISIYGIVTIFYLYNLNKLNILLTSEMKNETAIDILIYNNYQPCKYFGVMVALTIIGGIFVAWSFLRIKNGIYGDSSILVFLINIVVAAVFVILLIKFITIPILRAVATVVALGLGALYIWAND